jgi:DNA (cytosine-5)-methyltransferase 1
LKGDRSGLFYKFAEIIDARRPEWVVLENVPGLLNSQSGNDFAVVVRTLDEFGYGVAWRVFDAKHFGTPQRRRRVYIIASYRSLRAATVLFDEETLTIPLGTGNRERQGATAGDGTRVESANLYTIQHAAVGRKHTAGPQAKGYRNDGETWTLDSRGSADVVCAPYDAFGVRDLTGLSFGLDSNRYRAVGSAVAVPIVEWIGKRIVEIEEKEIEVNSKYEPQNYQITELLQPKLFD